MTDPGSTAGSPHSGSWAESLDLVLTGDWPDPVRRLLFGPAETAAARSWEEAIELVEAGVDELPAGYLPLASIDDASIACVVLPAAASPYPTGSVVRWFLTEVAARHQLRLVDVDALLYVESIRDELGSRKAGLKRMLDEIGPSFEASHLKRQKRPRDYVLRPVRIACQNVIVGLAAIAQESSYDGLAVAAWQTCEVPHVAAHEANRALAALILCDAFKNGGTMEIRFDTPTFVDLNGKRRHYTGHPEGQVPASLRRYARSVGVVVGADDPAAIVPAEARDLFLAMTPMPSDLKRRVEHATETLGLTPERACFTLLAPVWRAVELDLMLATSVRAASILEGGAEWTDRCARSAESGVCRAAALVGMLVRRLDSFDGAGSTDEVRPVEDRKQGVEWEIVEDLGAVRLRGLDPSVPLPWTHGHAGSSSLLVFPRATVTGSLGEHVQRAAAFERVAVVVPADAVAPAIEGAAVLRCPDRLADIDQDIEARLLSSRISRR